MSLAQLFYAKNHAKQGSRVQRPRPRRHPARPRGRQPVEGSQDAILTCACPTDPVAGTFKKSGGKTIILVDKVRPAE
jgi:hypothetical protein